MSAPDPVPAELQERITRLRDAMWEASLSKAADAAAYWRQTAAAKRALATVYREAAQFTPHDSLLRFALVDAASNLQTVAVNDEISALEFEASAKRAAKTGGE
jgi:hypothetical protein